MAGWQDDPVVAPQAKTAPSASWQNDPITQPQGAPAAAQLSPEATSTAQGYAAGAETGPLGAAAGQAARQGTFALSNYVDAAARNAVQKFKGNNETYAQSLAFERGKSSGEMAAHPVAGTVGGVVGGLAPGVAAALTTGGAGDVAMAASDAAKAGVGANLARNAVVGGTAAGVASHSEGETPVQTAEAVGAGAALSPLGIPLSFGLSKLAPASVKAMAALADAIKVPASALAAAYDSKLKLTGALPNMAELADDASQGRIQALAAKNGLIGSLANKAADAAGGVPAHEQLAAAAQARQASVAQGGPDIAQTDSGQHADRDAAMTAAMDEPHPATGVPLRKTPVNDQGGVLISQYVKNALKPNATASIQAGLSTNNAASPLQERFDNNTATMEDLDFARQRLRDMQMTYARPAIGATHMKDPLMAKEYANAAQQVEGLGRSTDSRYGNALDDFHAASQYTDGFNHGMTGRAIDDAGNADSMTRAALQTTVGKQGYDHGNALKQMQDISASFAPGIIKPQAQPGAGNAVQGAMAAVSHSPVFGILHAAKATKGIMPQMSPQAQAIVGKNLFSRDPVVVKQAIANLQRAGHTKDTMRQVGAALGGNAAANIESHLSQAYGQGQ